MPERFAGEVRQSGSLTARKLDPALLERAERRLAGLEGRIWANARYEDNAARVRITVAIPYDDVNDRVAVHSIELGEEDGSMALFESAFEALIQENMPRLLREARKASAACLLVAEQAGEMEDE